MKPIHILRFPHPQCTPQITALGDPQLLQRLSDLLQAGSGRRPGDLTGAPGGALGLEGGATEVRGQNFDFFFILLFT